MSRTDRVCDITECACKAVLEEEVSIQGCCINALHEYVRQAVAYDACGVDLPEKGCNNSPINIVATVTPARDSSANSKVSVISLIFALIAVLG